MTKAARMHMVRTLDVELHPHGIGVNAVPPQIIPTKMNRELFLPEMPAGAVQPDAIADVIAFLVSDAAAPTSGAVVAVNGG